MKQAIRMFKALGDPTRLRIIKLLEGGELCVCQLMAVLKMGQSRISRHLSILKKAGLIEDRKQGKWVYYRLCCPDLAGNISTIYKRLTCDPKINRDRSSFKVCGLVGPGKLASACSLVKSKQPIAPPELKAVCRESAAGNPKVL